MGETCTTIGAGQPVTGLIAMVGDDRGLTDEECASFAAVAEKAGAEVFRVSLGGMTLLASHTIVILQHYLDEWLHRCEVPKPRDYGFGKRASADGGRLPATAQQADEKKRARNR